MYLIHVAYFMLLFLVGAVLGLVSFGELFVVSDQVEVTYDVRLTRWLLIT